MSTRLIKTANNPLVFFIIPVIVYAVTSNVYFVGDDWSFLHMVQSVPIAQTPIWLLHSFTSFNGSDFYRPLSQNLFFLLSWHWFGLNPVGYHLVMLIVYGLTCITIYYLIMDFTRNRSAAFIGYGVFALAALHFEELAWICASCEVMATLFVVQSYRSYVGGNFWPSSVWYVLAVMSNETALFLPLAFLLTELVQGVFMKKWNLHTRSFRFAVGVDLFVVVLYFVFRFIIVGLHPNHAFSPNLSLIPQVFWKSLMNSIGLLPVFENVLLKFLSVHVVHLLFIIVTLLVYISLLVASTFEMVMRKNGLVITKGLILFAVMLLIILPIGNDYSEYNLSIPLVGLCVALAGAFHWTFKDIHLHYRVTALVGLTVLFTLISVSSIHEYMKVDGVVLGSEISRQYASLVPIIGPVVPISDTSLSEWAIEQTGSSTLEGNIIMVGKGTLLSEGRYTLSFDAETNSFTLHAK